MVGLIWFALVSGLLAYLPGGIKRVNYGKPVTVATRAIDEPLSNSNDIRHVGVGNSFRNDNFLISIYEPSGLLLPEALNTNEKCIHNECVSISNVSLHFHTSKQVSDPIACLTLPCSLRSSISINRTWEVSKKSSLKRKELEILFSRFLNLPLPKQLFSRSIVYKVQSPSVYILYFKPVSWIINGKYMKKLLTKTVESHFTVYLPSVLNETYLNGAFDVVDLCIRNSAYHPIKLTKCQCFEVINSFFYP
ncbi:hypothetical protein DSO57_1006661 [Entomophthora muscae]|uniref:Uncharacterized protein n=1 Tax=Entomophthora muscae TaxID=34485 RepID=A0ACC2SWT1_9FUNG|nr:hypothetical protein DSO57_1006661 [Entomophthora muscae]